jgi:hypothetical protein
MAGLPMQQSSNILKELFLEDEIPNALLGFCSAQSASDTCANKDEFSLIAGIDYKFTLSCQVLYV